jgi:protease-4
VSVLGGVVVAVVALVVGVPGQAWARAGETLGLAAPPVTPVDVADAWAWDISPGAAAFHETWSVVAGAAFRDAGLDGGAVGGGALASVPIAFGLVLGGGVEFLRAAPVLDDTGLVVLRPAVPYGRLTVGAAYALSDRLGIGLGVHHFFSERAPFAGVTTWDAGLVLRLAPAVALAAMVRDVGSPTYFDPALPMGGAELKTEREWTLALGLRPLARVTALTVTAGARLDESTRGSGALAVLVPFANVEWRTRAGVTLRAGAEFPLDTPAEPRLVAGAEFALGRFSVGGALAAAVPAAGAALDSLRWGSVLHASYAGAPIGPPLKEERIVELALTGSLGEIAGSRGLLGGESPSTTLELLLQLDRLARDRHVRAVVVRVSGGFKLGMSQLDDVAAAFDRLRAAGKKVYCHANGAGTRTVALCAHADRFAVSPPADVQLRGLASEVMFYRGALDKIGAEPEFIRIAEYKSAPEAYTEKEPTPENRAVREATMTALYDDLLGHLARGYGITKEKAAKLVDEGPYTPPRALAAGLVHDVVYWDEFKKRVSDTHPGLRWATGEGAAPRPVDWPANRAIAVLVVEGAITDGTNSVDPLSLERTAGAATLIRAIREIRDSPRYRALVLRIQSPGGSALASDLMWAELEKVRAKKPVIVSMGDLAASGGYYIAAAGSEVMCTDGTITGSIGIFTGKFSLAGLASWAGVHVETFKRGARADLYSMARPLTAEERAFALESLRYYYDQFVDRVSKGRKMTPEAVDKIARGHVWTGAAARGNGLCDKEGGLWAALERARALAGFPAGGPMPAVDVFPRPATDLVSVALRFVGLGRAAADDDADRTLAAAAAVSDLTGALGPLGPALRRAWPTWALYAPGTPLALMEDAAAFGPSD